MIENNLSNLIKSDFDTINSKKYENSIAKLLDQKPDGVSDKLAAQMLMITLEELIALHQIAQNKIAKYLV